MKFSRVFFRSFILIFIFTMYGIFLGRDINFFVADLGRLLKAGELFFQGFSIPQTNYYSYTYPDYPCINHHWASGVIFFLIQKLAGFNGLSIFFFAISIATFLLFFSLAWRYSNFEIASLVSVVMIPVIASRGEIRPEVFSYFFSGVFLWVLWNFKASRISWRWLFLLPLLEILWVNVHIYFFIGLLLIAAFLSEYSIIYLARKGKDEFIRIKKLALCLIFTFSCAFLNPAGSAGVFYPLRIIGAYGCDIVEMQPVYVIAKTKSIDFLPLIYFELAFILLLLSWLYVLIRQIVKKEGFSIANFILTLLFGAMGILAVRNFAPFGFFALPIAANNLRNIMKREADSVRDYCFRGALFISICLSIFLVNPEYWPRRSSLGIGLSGGSTQAIDFFKKADIQGPILNNFDVGGYLIYYLFPKERVFVDNRPEAYPASFFRDMDIGLQVNEKRWREAESRYGFNAIFFYHRVYTAWGQGFLIRRLSDPQWAAVYIDDACVILLKRNEGNQDIISKYELPGGSPTIKSLLTQ